MNESILRNVKTGFPIENKKPLLGTSSVGITNSSVIKEGRNCDSIIDSIDTGFGPEQIVTKPQCKKPKIHSHLYKEHYLGEFKSPTEKALARHNLGVYSKEEIDKFLSKAVDSITKSEVEDMIANADFIKSTLKSLAGYSIPEDLFKL